VIDKIDQEILLQLQKNGRESYVEISKNCHVSETTVRNRVRQLMEKNILKIVGLPTLKELGYGFMAIVGLQVRLTETKATAEQLIKYPNVCYLANVTGRYDFLAVVVTKSAEEFAPFVQNVISAIPSVLRTETFVGLHVYKGQITGLDAGMFLHQLDIA
jgi:DNA-binding Lrp family transcriptional regulator